MIILIVLLLNAISSTSAEIDTTRIFKSRNDTICKHAPDPGPCLNPVRQWYWDAQSGRCSRFTYGGCLGNSNRFENRIDCKHACHRPIESNKKKKAARSKRNRVQPEYCRLPPAEGECADTVGLVTERSKWYYYYSTHKNTCALFWFWGCGGNRNKFKTKSGCRRHCVRSVRLLDEKKNTEKPGCPQCSSKTSTCVWNETAGRMTCECKPGFMKNPVNGKCESIQAAMEIRSEKLMYDCTRCDINAQCLNNLCVCNEGFQGDGYHCNDVNECGLQSPHVCDRNAICENTIGSFRCECDTGYAGNGFICTNSSDVCLDPFEQSYTKSCHVGDWQPRFYFNATSKTCERFWYDGCTGSSRNIFADSASCETLCSQYLPQPTQTTTIISPACLDPFDESFSAQCHHAAWQLRAFYNATIGICEIFWYDKCDGHGNNIFRDLQTCRWMCEGVMPSDEELQLSTDLGNNDVSIADVSLNLPFDDPGAQNRDPSQNAVSVLHVDLNSDGDERTQTATMPSEQFIALPQTTSHSSTKSTQAFMALNVSSSTKPPTAEKPSSYRTSDPYHQLFTPTTTASVTESTTQRDVHQIEDATISITLITTDSPVKVVENFVYFDAVCYEPFDMSYTDQCANGNWLPRYYYNAPTQSCMQFWYDQCSGSGHNFFNTRVQCVNTCVKGEIRQRIRNENQPLPTKSPGPEFDYNNFDDIPMPDPGFEPVKASTALTQEVATVTPKVYSTVHKESVEELMFGYPTDPNACLETYDPSLSESCALADWKTRYFYNATVTKCESIWWDGCYSSNTRNFFVELDHCIRLCQHNVAVQIAHATGRKIRVNTTSANAPIHQHNHATNLDQSLPSLETQREAAPDQNPQQTLTVDLSKHISSLNQDTPMWDPLGVLNDFSTVHVTETVSFKPVPVQTVTAGIDRVQVQDPIGVSGTDTGSSPGSVTSHTEQSHPTDYPVPRHFPGDNANLFWDPLGLFTSNPQQRPGNRLSYTINTFPMATTKGPLIQDKNTDTSLGTFISLPKEHSNKLELDSHGAQPVQEQEQSPESQSNHVVSNDIIASTPHPYTVAAIVTYSQDAQNADAALLRTPSSLTTPMSRLVLPKRPESPNEHGFRQYVPSPAPTRKPTASPTPFAAPEIQDRATRFRYFSSGAEERTTAALFYYEVNTGTTPTTTERTEPTTTIDHSMVHQPLEHLNTPEEPNGETDQHRYTTMHPWELYEYLMSSLAATSPKSLPTYTPDEQGWRVPVKRTDPISGVTLSGGTKTVVCKQTKSAPCLDQFDENLMEECGEGNWESRYYFDNEHERCVEFWYDGCKSASTNIFPDAEACQCLCDPKVTHLIISDDNPGLKSTRRSSIHGINPNGKTNKIDYPSSSSDTTLYPQWASPMFENTNMAFSGMSTSSRKSPEPASRSIESENSSNNIISFGSIGVLLRSSPAQHDTTSPTKVPDHQDYLKTEKDAQSPPLATIRVYNHHPVATTESARIRIANGTFEVGRRRDEKLPRAKTADPVCFKPFDVRYMDSCGGGQWTTKYMFDADTNRCKMFWYDGCPGTSKNMFDDIETCQWMCEGVHPEPESRSCLDEFDAVYEDDCRGGNYDQRFYFDTRTKQCRQFSYGGCKSKSRNIFTTAIMCEALCERPHRALSRGCLDTFDETYTSACGDAQFKQRYYYDHELKQCKMFWYGNCKGENENIWNSLATCQWICERPKSYEPPKHCIDQFDAHYKDACTNGEWLERFYFDHRTGRCTSFWYDGCKSESQNIFPDKHTCEWLCEQPSPPYLTPTTDSGKCLADVAKGNCTMAYPAYYYDRLDGVCKPFYYTGCNGNSNRFLTLQQCDQTCLKFAGLTGVHSDCALPLDVGSGKDNPRCVQRAGYRYFYNPVFEKCGRFWYSGCGGNSNKFYSIDECETTCGAQPVAPLLPHKQAVDPQVCFEAKEAGRCGSTSQNRLFEIDSRKRYYYDSRAKKCKTFTYAGCGGNNNRFGDLESCKAACGDFIKPVNDYCAAWPDWGPCNQLRWMWFYNLTLGTCQQFLWGGCGGNSNRFHTFSECQVECEVTGIDVCNDPPRDRGTFCETMSFKYYFDKANKRCEGFHYTGCGTSANRFDTMNECLKTCVLKRPAADAPYSLALALTSEREQEETSGTARRAVGKEKKYKNKEPEHERVMNRHSILSTAPETYIEPDKNVSVSRYLKSSSFWIDYNQCLGYRYNVSGVFTELRAFLCLMEKGVKGECVSETHTDTNGEEHCRLVRPWLRGPHLYSWFFTIDKKSTYFQEPKISQYKPSHASVMLMGVNRCFDVC